jgi:Holliday junction resolvase RusA-like endonuclease
MPDLLTRTDLLLDFEVRGTPAPQGSKHARPIYRGKADAREFTGKVAVVESSKSRVKEWRQDVVTAAVAAMAFDRAPGTFPATGPLEVGMVFVVARPVGHFRTGRHTSGTVRDSAPAWPAVAPDLSKLVRATEDALTTAGVWGDDKQVVEYSRLLKCYPEAGALYGLTAPGARITIWRAL